MGTAWHRLAPAAGAALALNVLLGACSRTGLGSDAGLASGTDGAMPACQGEKWSRQPPREVTAQRSRVLLVFDRSASMDTAWSGRPRFEAAAGAVQQALSPLADSLTLGALFFPSSMPPEEAQCIDPTGIACIFVPGLSTSGSTCEVTAIDSEDQLPFMPGGEFLAQLERGDPPPYAPVNGGLTPLGEALLLADDALVVPDDALVAPAGEPVTTVVVITDGEPNCEWDAAQSQQQVEAWGARGIRTHVLGLAGIAGDGVTVLDELAAAGGTGAHIPADEPETLARALQAAVVEDARFDGCELAIDPPLAGPLEHLDLVVRIAGKDHRARRNASHDNASHDADPDYTLSEDGTRLDLHTGLCVAATRGDVQLLRLVQQCEELPWLTP